MNLKDSRNSNQTGPEFLCIGMQKAATRWLYDQLRSHIDVWMPPIKEFHFFNNGFNFDRVYNLCGKFLKRHSFKEKDGYIDASFFFEALFSDNAKKQYRIYKNYKNLKKNYRPNNHHQNNLKPYPPYEPNYESIEWYKSLFMLSVGRISGDITPAYCFLESKIIKKIALEFPNIKIILLVRNPIDRLWSQIRMAVRRGKLNEKILESSKDILKIVNHNYHFYLRSFPSMTYKLWSGEIPSKNIGIFFFDDICLNPKKVIIEICKFLNISSKQTSTKIDSHYDQKAKQYKIKTPDDIKKELKSFFSKEIIKCQELFGGPSINW